MTDRDRLIEWVCDKIQDGHCIGYCNHPPCNQCKDLADHLIANGVQIVRHGKWEYIGTDKHGNVFRCSYCALRIGLDYETTYCPHCGAKMDLEEKK